MSRRSVLLITIILPSIMAGCSYRYDFVVVNRSEMPIQVQYKLKRHVPETPGKFGYLSPPAKLPIEEFQKSKHEWRNLLKDEYGRDNSTGTFTVRVAADEVLLIASTNGGDEFDVETIRITGSKGSINLEGKQAQTQFKYQSDQKYVLEYR